MKIVVTDTSKKYKVTVEQHNTKGNAMSNQVNDRLFDRAVEVCEYFQGKLLEKQIVLDYENNDLDSMELHVREGERIIFEQEYNPSEGLIGAFDSMLNTVHEQQGVKKGEK